MEIEEEENQDPAELDDLDDNFDYMELLDMQYAQYYAMTSVPPFDPTAPPPVSTGGPLTAPGNTGVVDPALAAALPGLAVAQAQADRQAAAAAALAMASTTVPAAVPPSPVPVASMMSPIIPGGTAIVPGEFTFA